MKESNFIVGNFYIIIEINKTIKKTLYNKLFTIGNIIRFEKCFFYLGIIDF